VITLGPSVRVTLPTAAQPTLPVPYPSQAVWAGVLMQNASPFPLLVYESGQYLGTLMAWTANVYPLAPPRTAGSIPPGPLTVVALQPAGTAVLAEGDNTLYTSFALYGDSFAGVYPQSLTDQAVYAVTALSTSTSSAGFPIGSSHQSVNVPGWAVSASLQWNNTSSNTLAIGPVLGANTGQQYYPLPYPNGPPVGSSTSSPGPQQPPISFLLNPTDTALTIYATASGPPNTVPLYVVFSGTNPTPSTDAPMAVQDTSPPAIQNAHWPYQQNSVAINGNVVLLSPPANGTVWEAAYGWFYAAAGATGGVPRFQGASSGFSYWAALSSTAAQALYWQPGTPVYISEGVNFVNASGAVGNAGILARLCQYVPS
jgi:hypothetical protein